MSHSKDESQQVSGASYQKVDDRQLVRAVGRADGACVNGQPDRAAIADVCDLTAQRIADRLNDLARRGHVEIHKSIRVDRCGTCNSYAVVSDPDCIDPHAQTFEAPTETAND